MIFSHHISRILLLFFITMGTNSVLAMELPHGVLQSQQESAQDQLLYAIDKGDISLIKQALDSGANINKQDADGKTALMCAAAKSGNVPIIELLCKRGAAVNTQDFEGKTTLFYALNSGDEEIINTILTHGANPDIQDKKGNTPLLYLLEPFHRGIIIMKTDKFNKIHSIVKREMKKDELNKIVALLLNHKAHVDIQNNEGFTSLIYAIERQDIDIVTLLLDYKADVNMHGSRTTPPLISASLFGVLDIITLLLDRGADVNIQQTSSGDTALIRAARCRNKAVIKLLLERNAYINTQDCDGQTALMNVIHSLQSCEDNDQYNENMDVISLLLTHGAKTDLVDKNGRSVFLRRIKPTMFTHFCEKYDDDGYKIGLNACKNNLSAISRVLDFDHQKTGDKSIVLERLLFDGPMFEIMEYLLLLNGDGSYTNTKESYDTSCKYLSVFTCIDIKDNKADYMHVIDLYMSVIEKLLAHGVPVYNKTDKVELQIRKLRTMYNEIKVLNNKNNVPSALLNREIGNKKWTVKKIKEITKKRSVEDAALDENNNNKKIARTS